MGLRNIMGDAALPSTARAAGTFTSGPVANSGMAADVLLMVHASATSGSPTLDASIEESADGVGSWTAVPGSAITQLTAAGNRVAFCTLTKPYFRVTSTVAGTTPNVTYRAVVGVIPE